MLRQPVFEQATLQGGLFLVVQALFASSTRVRQAARNLPRFRMPLKFIFGFTLKN